MGFGHKERVYQKSLAYEFDESKLEYKIEPSLDVKYKGNRVGIYKPDFLIEDKVIIELKATEFLVKQFETQLTYYLKATNYKLGLLVNFGSPKLVIKRLIWSNVNPRTSAKDLR